MKRLLISISIVISIVVAVLLGATFVNPTTPSSEAQTQSEPPSTVTASYLSPSDALLQDSDVSAQIWQEEENLRLWYAAVQSELDRQAEQERLTAIRQNGGSIANRSFGSCNGDVACFLACTRAHESDTSGGYGAVSSGGTYRGAYQFAQGTWKAAVSGAGWAEYADMSADQVPPEIQDAAAVHLYGISGTRPWGGRC